MEIQDTPIKGLMIIKPNVFDDNRGYFYESWNKELFQILGNDIDFVQDNQSLSQKDVLRGLHFQKPPYEQGKLVHVIKGSVMDISLDIRKNSPTYGHHFSVILSDENKKLLWVPPGFAHGFVALESDTIFTYKCTNFYNKDAEGTLLWNDSDLNINWGVEDPIISEKDAKAESFRNFTTKF